MLRALSDPVPALRFLALAGVLAVICGGCGEDADGGSGAPQYVGAAGCVGCHEEAAAAHRGSHHDLAMQAATAESVLGDFADVRFEHRGDVSTFRRDGDRFLVTTPGPDDAPTTYEVRYVFGVTPLQQYLIEFPGGRLQCLRIAWDSRPADQGGQRWFALYPGEDLPGGDPLHWTGRNQNWNQMCAACHSTDLRKRYDRNTDSYDTTWRDIDVSCEACHGPGSAHVAWADAGADADEPDGLVVDLSPQVATWAFLDDKVTATRIPEWDGNATEVETCAPCHSRRTELRDDSWHGQRFLDNYRPALLDRDLYHADGQILDEVYVWGSFVQSKMYHAGVSCQDCHDPHSARTRSSDNSLCLRCHQAEHFDTFEHTMHQPGTRGSLCVDCHMPETTYMVVDPRRDHSIRIPRPRLAQRLGAPDACSKCHEDEGQEWCADTLDQHLRDTGRDPAILRRPHFGVALAAGRRGAPGAGALLRGLAGDAEQPAIARATALSLLAERPIRSNIEALVGGLQDDDPLVRFGAVDGLQNLPASMRLQLGAIALHDPIRAVRATAAQALADAPPERLDPSTRDALARAIGEYESSQRLNSDRAWARVNLALTLQQRGDLAGAEREYRAAIRQEPYSVRPYANLADLFRQQDRERDAEAVLREGIDKAYETADLDHALGLLLVRRGARDAALEHLERAALARPEEPRYAYVLAVGQVDAGRVEAGIQTLQAAVGRHPRDADLIAALAGYERDRGNRSAARRWAERLVDVLPDDRGARDLLDSLR